MRILYVHGYNGEAYGSSYRHLKNAAGDRHEVLSVDYDAENPREAIATIKKAVQELGIDAVIGASLGGFLTMHVFGVSRIIVNPCWDPAKELPLVGYTGGIGVYSELLEEFKQHTDFEEKNLCCVCIAPLDELLGERYRNELAKHFSSVYEISGGHRICKDSAEEIVNKYLLLHDENVSTFVKQLREMYNLPMWDI